MLMKLTRRLLGSRVESQVPSENVYQTSPILNMGSINETMVPQEFHIPPHLNPYINPSADFETYRQLVEQQRFHQKQQNNFLQDVVFQSNLDNFQNLLKQQRFYQQQHNLDANPELVGYYQRLNQYYANGAKGLKNEH